MNQNNFQLTSKEPSNSVIINVNHYKKSILVLKAVQHKLRLNMLVYIAKHQPVTVTNIYNHFLLEQSAASQHLAILRKIGIVNITRNGKFIYYAVNFDKLKTLNIIIEKLIN